MQVDLSMCYDSQYTTVIQSNYWHKYMDAYQNTIRMQPKRETTFAYEKLVPKSEATASGISKHRLVRDIPES